VDEVRIPSSGDPFTAKPAPRRDADTVETHYAGLGRLYACAGCGEGFPRPRFVVLVEGNHDDLTFFHGDMICAECADNAGVAR